MKILPCLLAACTGVIVSQSLQAQVPLMIHYQGRMISNGTNFNGAGRFKFALVNNTGTTTYWSHNGSSAGGSEPTTVIPRQVDHGLYSILLGDTSVPNMTRSIPPDVFTNSAVYLRIWFSDGVSGDQLLSPDQRIAAVGYAMMSADVPDGIITESKLADDAVTSGKLADGAVTSVKLAAGVVSSTNLNSNIDLGAADTYGSLDIYRITDGSPAISLSGSANRLSLYQDDGGYAARLDGNSYGELFLYDSVGGQIGARLSAYNNNGGYLGLYNSNGNTRAYISGANAGGWMRLYQADNNTGVFLEGDNAGSGLITLHNTNGSTRMRLYGQGDGGGGEISINNVSGQEALTLQGYSYGGQINMKDNAGVNSVLLESSPSGGGYLFLYNEDGDIGVHVDGDSGGAGYINLRNTNGATRLVLDGYGSAAGGDILVYANDGSVGARIYGNGNENGGQVIAYAGDGSQGVNIMGDDNGGGLIQAMNSSGQARLELEGNGSSGGGQINLLNRNGDARMRLYGDSGEGSLLYLYSADGSLGVTVDGESTGGGLLTIYNTNSSARIVLDGSSTGYGGEISVRDANGTETIELVGAETVDQGGEIRIKDAAGNITIRIDGDFEGDGRVTTEELEITGGSDLSEQFDVKALRHPVEPGMVVCIDTKNPGQLITSSKAYDRTVAGIISGAGGVKPGMLMSQKGSKADGHHPVALTGRVYCMVDTTHGAIEPGDLLTTSETPGHAMKATDHFRAQGAILGKAMTSLEDGKGLVLVLVSLQ